MVDEGGLGSGGLLGFGCGLLYCVLVCLLVWVLVVVFC